VNALKGVFDKFRTSRLSFSGDDPCNGTATDDTDLDSNPNINPGIKCDCTYQNNTVCHITKL
jgi:hypothetical protein